MPRPGLRRAVQLVLAGLRAVLPAAAVLGALGWAVYWVAQPATLPIRTVRIEGNFLHLTTDELQQAVAPHVEGGFFSVDVEAVKAAAEALLWVDKVAVRRLWPDTLRIRVDEHQPLARWGEGELVSTRGVRFAPPAEALPKGLPELRGQAGQERLMAVQFRTMVAALRPLGVSIASLTVDERRAWRMELNNGIELILGRSDVESRLERFVRHYPAVLAPRLADIRRVDMRYPNGFAVAWRRPEAAGPLQRG